MMLQAAWRPLLATSARGGGVKLSRGHGVADTRKLSGVGGRDNVSTLRTGTTAALWAKRLELEAYKKGATKQQEVLIAKKPSDSHFKIELPVSSDPTLTGQYLNFRGGLRFGKLLEDLDAFAGNVAFLHCDDGSPDTKQHTLVTASVDRVDVLRPITLQCTDLVMLGQASWAGRSSLQINIGLYSASDMKKLLSGSVVFVSVGPDNKGVAINTLTPSTPEEVKEFEDGAKDNEKRKADRKTSLKKVHPTDEESQLLHRIMTQDTGGVQMTATMLSSTELMQPQERNRSGKIFGGFLMRQAYELAYSTASCFCASSPADPASGSNGAPTIVAVDDVSFNRPISIGDVVEVRAQVVFTGSNELESRGAPLKGAAASVFQTRVDIHIIDLKTGKRNLSNEFHFTFLARETQEGEPSSHKIVPFEVRPVKPTTYSEGMLWLDGRRRMHEAIKIGKSSDSTMWQSFPDNL